MVKNIPSVMYVICTCVSNIFIAHINTRLIPIQSLFFCVIIAIAFFNAINLHQLRRIYQAVIVHWPFSLLINITMIGVWLSTFYALRLVDPFTFALFYFCIPVILSTAAQGIKKTSWLYYVLTAALIYTLFYYVDSSYSEHAKHWDHHFSDGVIISMIGGLSSFLYRKYSHVYSEKINASPSMVLAVRSYGLLFTVLLLFFLPHSTSLLSALSEKTFILLLAVALFSFIIPLYLNQKGIQDAGYIMHSCIAALIPFLSWGVSYIAGVLKAYNQNIEVLMIATLISVFTMVLNYMKKIGATS